MIAVRLIPASELAKKLSPYGCRKVTDIEGCAELWETGWGEGFTLMPEDGKYDEWQYRRVLAEIIATTMPSDWNSNGK